MKYSEKPHNMGDGGGFGQSGRNFDKTVTSPHPTLCNQFEFEHVNIFLLILLDLANKYERLKNNIFFFSYICYN